jgi:hypothetical protein
MNKIFCPHCYAEYEEQPERCSCGYPFSGNDMEKYQFMSKKVKGVNTIKEGIKSADYARLILFIIGGLNLLISIVFLTTGEKNPFYVASLVFSIMLIGLGFISFKEPFLSLLLGFIILIVLYLIMGIIDPEMFLRSLITKILFLGGFVYGLVKIKQAEQVLKEKNDFNRK